MKSEKGITLISLIIYVTVMLVVVMIVGAITNYFYANVNKQYIESKNENNIANLDMYLLKDLKNKKVIIQNEELEDMEVGIESDNVLLIYSSGDSIFYSIKDNGIYREKVKLFSKEESDDIVFILENVIQTDGTISSEKAELKILKNSEVIKSYIVKTDI